MLNGLALTCLTVTSWICVAWIDRIFGVEHSRDNRRRNTAPDVLRAIYHTFTEVGTSSCIHLPYPHAKNNLPPKCFSLILYYLVGRKLGIITNEINELTVGVSDASWCRSFEATSS